MDSYLTVRKFLGHHNTCKFPNVWHTFIKKKSIIPLPAEWRKDNHPPPKKVPKPSPVAKSSSSDIEEKPKAENKVNLKAPTTNSYSQGYRMPWKMCFRWPEQLWNYRKRRKPDWKIRNNC
ncbi:hypothetical protein O181_022023 [Austropuccinia psidii MF-1]|uniref:Uncharacterized protein n=1 Tax=Austropuccinia psidii MF-1 TaxID=1389203 RepID=A0A9Q3CG08_9BASI|nr:hypothetical protein [Austropuccinia psidii MF-1]